MASITSVNEVRASEAGSTNSGAQRDSAVVLSDQAEGAAQRAPQAHLRILSDERLRLEQAGNPRRRQVAEQGRLPVGPAQRFFRTTKRRQATDQ